MNRSIVIEIDPKTWPKPPAVPTFPTAFHKGSSTDTINFPSMLLMIGFLTTPIEQIGPSLSQYWAYVRYLSAITNGPDLRITRAFAALDSHQKTILSDDFGMGLPMSWICEKLNAFAICDGRYFIKALALSVGAKAPKTSARGPNKSPDFVILDTNGDWHVVECKGTQSGIGYRNKQLGRTTPKPTGGIAQKRTIVFPNAHTGQRLACGLAIGVENGPTVSNLRIVDPTSKATFNVEEGWLKSAKDIASRATLAKSLRLAGFEATATFVSLNTPVPEQTKRPSLRQRRLEQLRVEARAELNDDALEKRAVFEEGRVAFYGRELTLDLSGPLGGADQVSVRQGVSRTFIERLLAADLTDQRRDFISPEVLEIAGGLKLINEDDQGASLRLGSMLTMELRLKRRQALRA